MKMMLGDAFLAWSEEISARGLAPTDQHFSDELRPRLWRRMATLASPATARASSGVVPVSRRANQHIARARNPGRPSRWKNFCGVLQKIRPTSTDHFWPHRRLPLPSKRRASVAILQHDLGPRLFPKLKMFSAGSVVARATNKEDDAENH